MSKWIYLAEILWNLVINRPLCSYRRVSFFTVCVIELLSKLLPSNACLAQAVNKYGGNDDKGLFVRHYHHIIIIIVQVMDCSSFHVIAFSLLWLIMECYN